MTQKIVFIVIIVAVVLAAGFMFILQQRQAREVEQPAVQLPEPESRIQKLLKSLGISSNQSDLTEAEKEDLLENLGESPNRRDLSEEEKEELLQSLGTNGSDKQVNKN